MDNLRLEGLSDRAVLTGDVMFDASLTYRSLAESRANALADKWQPGAFALATVHRAENTDDTARLSNIVSALDRIARTVCPVVWPVHPRTRKRLAELGLSAGAATLIEPVSFLDMLLLESRARVILTDSGGVQKEAFFYGVPCITLRDETEWIETVETGWNQLVGADPDRIRRAVEHGKPVGAARVETFYGAGDASRKIVSALTARSLGVRGGLTT